MSGHRMSLAEREQAYERLSAEHDSTYIIEAYVRLVTPMREEIGKAFMGEILSISALARANEICRGHVCEWREQYRNVPAFQDTVYDCHVDLRYNQITGAQEGLEIVCTEPVIQLKQGIAQGVHLFKMPSDDRAVRRHLDHLDRQSTRL